MNLLPMLIKQDQRLNCPWQIRTWSSVLEVSVPNHSNAWSFEVWSNVIKMLKTLNVLKVRVQKLKKCCFLYSGKSVFLKLQNLKYVIFKRFEPIMFWSFLGFGSLSFSVFEFINRFELTFLM